MPHFHNLNWREARGEERSNILKTTTFNNTLQTVTQMSELKKRLQTCMQETRLPFWTEQRLEVLAEKRVALLRPEKALTELDSEVVTAEVAAAKAAGATAAEAATMEAIARSGALGTWRW